MNALHRLAACLAFLAPGASAAELAVTVADMRSDQGQVRVALFDDPAAFPDGRRVGAAAPARIGAVRLVFSDLPPGDWAVAAIHDADADGVLGRGLFGIPTEGFGFANGARGRFGPPDFAAAVVTVPESGAEVTIHLTY